MIIMMPMIIVITMVRIFVFLVLLFCHLIRLNKLLCEQIVRSFDSERNTTEADAPKMVRDALINFGIICEKRSTIATSRPNR